MAVRNLDDSNRLFAVEVDMDNRSAEDIARDAALQIVALFDRLAKEQHEKEESQMMTGGDEYERRDVYTDRTGGKILLEDL